MIVVAAISAMLSSESGGGYSRSARALFRCLVERFGDSHAVPDPRDVLDAQPACP